MSVCGEGSCVLNARKIQSCDFLQEVILDQTPTTINTVLTLHTVSVVMVQAVLTPIVHVEAAAHVVHR